MIRRERAKASMPEKVRVREEWVEKMKASEKRRKSMLAKMKKKAVCLHGFSHIF